MFDNTKPNIILISDNTDVISMSRSLGIHKVAYCLRLAGYQVAVIHHASTFSIKEITHLLSELVTDQTLFVGINNFFYSSISDVIVRDGGSVELARVENGSLLPHGHVFNDHIKNTILQKNKHCKLVLGGPTALDVDYNSIFDYIIVGYAEQSVVSLADFLSNRTTELPPKHKSIYGPIIINDSKAVGYDFSSSHMYYEDHDAILPKETLALEVGRGCIFKCAFCSYPMNGKKKMDFIRSMELIRKELIDNYTRFGTTNYLIVDDTFNDSVEKCREFSEMVKSLPFKISWWAYIRLDLLAAHPETIDYLIDAGLTAALCGIETLNTKTGSIIGKGGSREKLFDTVRILKEKSKDAVSVHGNFIFGLPHESMDSMKSTAEYLLSDDNPLDTWRAYALNIKPTNRSYAHEFLSDLDINYEKYGYSNMGPKKSSGTLYSPGDSHEAGQMRWKNEHTTRDDIEIFATEIDNRRKQKDSKVGGRQTFYIASLGVDLHQLLNVNESQVNWYELDQLKLSRSIEYKIKLHQELGVSYTKMDIPDEIKTYSELLKSKKLVDNSPQ